MGIRNFRITGETMNDKDKEAFNKYICTHDQGILQHSDDTDIDVAERAWQAACEYKQKEIDELRVKLNVCKNDYWFMINLIERYSSDKDQVLKDCLDRMKFRKGLFNILE